MKVNFDDKVRTFKTLEGLLIRRNNLDIMIVVKASEIVGRQIFDVKQGATILEENKVKISLLFDEQGKPLTLKTVCIDVLNAPRGNQRGEKNDDWETRYKQGKLMEKIYGAKGEIELDSDQVTQIKKLLAESNYLNTVLLQAFDWLEGKEK